MAGSHPSVIYINAITSTPQISEQRCYDTEQAAFDDMCGYEPFNNTMVSPRRCTLVHCPHGCTNGGARTRPVAQEAVIEYDDYPGVRPSPKPTGRWRCPKCHTEYTPGEPPAIPAAQLAVELTMLGLADVEIGQYGSWPVVVSAVFPPGNRDAAGWVVRVTEQVGRAITSTPDRLAEPYWMGLFAADARHWVTDPIHQWERMTLPQVREMITGYMGDPPRL